jgi:hypothetical protein
MYIYHYSSDKYSELRSLRKQSGRSKKELDQIDKDFSFNENKYTNNISFFIEPIPYDIIGDLFNNKHNVWKNGNVLYEYMIDVNTLEKNIYYSLVESPEDIKTLDLNYDKDMTDKEFDIYIKNKLDAKYARGETGIGRANLIKQIKLYLGTTRQLFIDARKRYDAELTKTKYAANVPHLMLYPSSGIIQYQKYDQITIGKKD